MEKLKFWHVMIKHLDMILAYDIMGNIRFFYENLFYFMAIKSLDFEMKNHVLMELSHYVHVILIESL